MRSSGEPGAVVVSEISAAAPPPSASPAGFAAALEDSRHRLLAAVCGGGDVTFVRGVGNLGDELIYAGTRRLLSAVEYREIALDEVPQASGATAVLAGGGAWCRSYHELMPLMLPLAELRFERVVVLPSSFDLAVEEVRGALSRSRALLFARERESYEQLHRACPDCRVELAHDGAFFFDYAPYRRAGSGELLAMRSDREAVGPAPDGSRDISRTCSSLDEWLWEIAGHAAVITDRAHVMIAAALLGKRVEWSPSNYHKLPALAEYALRDFDVRQMPRRAPAARPGTARPARRAARGAAPAAALLNPGAPAPPALAAASSAAATAATAAPAAPSSSAVRARLLDLARHNPPPPRPSGGRRPDSGGPRVTIAVLTRDRPRLWSLLLQSLRDHVREPFHLLLVDNNSAPAARAELQRLCAQLFPARGGAPGESAAEVVWSSDNLGCAGARQLAVQRLKSEFLMFLDDDAEVFPGTVEHLLATLDAMPNVLAVGAHIVLPDGRTWFCGGEIQEEPPGVLRCVPLGLGLDLAEMGAARSCSWLAGCAVMIRRSILEAEPLDLEMAAYYEDTEWCYRLCRRYGEGVLRIQPASLVLHHHQLKGPRAGTAAEILAAMPFLQAIAHFYRAHGLLLDGVFTFAPELASDGAFDVEAARLLLELLLGRGADWLAMQWLNGGLAPLLEGRRPAAPTALAVAAGGEPEPLRDRQGLLDELNQARTDLTVHSRELAEVRGELVVLRHALRVAQGDDDGWKPPAQRELEAIRASRAWRLAQWIWRLRLAAGRLFGSRPEHPQDTPVA